MPLLSGNELYATFTHLLQCVIFKVLSAAVLRVSAIVFFSLLYVSVQLLLQVPYATTGVRGICLDLFCFSGSNSAVVSAVCIAAVISILGSLYTSMRATLVGFSVVAVFLLILKRLRCVSILVHFWLHSSRLV